MQELRGTQTRGDAYMVVVLAAGYFLAFLDRQSLALFVIPIEHDLHLTDLQMGLLLGFAFGLLYALLGVPCGLLADRVNRRRLIMAGIAFWSVSTLVCALASDAVQLFVGRIGVGIGEATLAPAATSMIADAFAPWQRGRAFGVFSLGTTFGAGTASLLGAGVIALLAQAQIQAPVLGTLRAWQVTLAIVALAAVPVIVALWSVREPPRRARAGALALPVPAIAAHLLRHWRLYALIYLSNVLASLMSYAFYPWVPAAMERLWHVSRASIGVHLGLMIIGLSSIGIYGSGWLVDRLNLRGRHHGLALLGTAVFVVLAVVAGVMFQLPHVGLTWMLIGLYILLVHIYFPFALLALSIVTPPGAMAALAALNFMFTGILGLSLGPTLVVLVARAFFPAPSGTARAISAVCMGLALLGALSYALLIRPLRSFARPAA